MSTPCTCNLCGETFDASAARLFVKDGHPIVRCPSCGLVFRSTLPTRAELDEIYGAGYFGADVRRSASPEGYLDYVADAEIHRVNARRRLKRLAALTTPGTLLDVGCAAGFFVDEAARRGWQAHGIDVSETMVDWGRRALAVDIRLGTLEDAPFVRIESCITMWDYIEHALDPRRDLELAFSRLRSGGVLALSTGDAGSVLARLSLERWHLMTPRHHNYFFAEDTITRLLESVGFELVELRHAAAVYPVRYLAHKAGLVVRAPVVDAVARRLARSRLGSCAVPFTLWDVMTVVARRPASVGGRAAREHETVALR